MRKHEVYFIRNTVNHKVYIGITKNGHKVRFRRHLYDAGRGSDTIIHRAIRKYGPESFYVELVCDNLTEEEACREEIRLIEEFDSCGDGGYNISIGGGSGIHTRPETIAKKSRSAKKAWENSEAWQASVQDPERNAKIGAASAEMWKSPEYREAFRKRHDDMVELSRDPECRKRAVQKYKQNGHSVPVTCVDTGDQFDSCADAARWASELTGFKFEKGHNIRACANGLRKKAYGMSWNKA